MGEKTGIEWTTATFNPWWGCAHVSPGCVRCCAETLAHRYGHDVWGAKGSRRTFGAQHWRQPLVWNRKAQAEGRRWRVFCASMADVFEDHPALDDERTKLWELVATTPWLDWQLLTKRPENVARMAPWGDCWPANVWLGASAEDQEWATARLARLVEIPARVRFASCEPLISEVDLHRLAGGARPALGDRGRGVRRRSPADGARLGPAARRPVRRSRRARLRQTARRVLGPPPRRRSPGR